MRKGTVESTNSASAGSRTIFARLRLSGGRNERPKKRKVARDRRGKLSDRACHHDRQNRKTHFRELAHLAKMIAVEPRNDRHRPAGVHNADLRIARGDSRDGAVHRAYPGQRKASACNMQVIVAKDRPRQRSRRSKPSGFPRSRAEPTYRCRSWRGCSQGRRTGNAKTAN